MKISPVIRPRTGSTFAHIAEGFAYVLKTKPILALLLLLGLVSSFALVAYLAASRLLSFSLFGLLTYLEPVLLVVVAVLVLGETVSPTQMVTYGAIVVAILLLCVEGIVHRPRTIPLIEEQPTESAASRDHAS